MFEINLFFFSPPTNKEWMGLGFRFPFLLIFFVFFFFRILYFFPPSSFPSCITFHKLRECLLISISGTRGIMYRSQKEVLTYSYFTGTALFFFFFNRRCMFSLQRNYLSTVLVSATMESWNAPGIFWLLRSAVSCLRKAVIHTNTAHFSQKMRTDSLGDPCIWLYFQLIGTTASFTTTNGFAQLTIFIVCSIWLQAPWLAYFLPICCLIKFVL